MSTEDYLGQEKIGKLLIRFSLPCILSMLVSALYNIVDQIFIGNSPAGYLGNAATNVVFPLTVLALAVALMLGDGAATYLSISQGRKDTSSAAAAIGSALTVSVLLAAVLTSVCLIWLDPILTFLGASADSFAYAETYGRIVIAAFPLAIIMNMLSSLIRADGSPKYAMAAMLSGAVFNIIFDPIFISVFSWGVAGAAYATDIGEFISFVMTVIYFRFSKTFHLSWKNLRIEWKLLLVDLRFGVSSFLIQLSIVIVSSVTNNCIVRYGPASSYGTDIPLAVLGIVMKVFSIVINIVIGIAVGGQPVIGYNYGAGKIGRVKETYRKILISSALVALVATLFFEAGPDLLIRLFGSEDEVYNSFARLAFRIYLSLILFTAIQKCSSIFLQAIGYAKEATFLSLLRDVIALVPATLLLTNQFGLLGILYAAPVADAIALAFTVICVLFAFRRLKKSQESSKQKERQAAPVQG
jgi:putative MATE family efflux protein